MSIEERIYKAYVQWEDHILLTREQLFSYLEIKYRRNELTIDHNDHTDALHLAIIKTITESAPIERLTSKYKFIREWK